ncbi:Ig-like domain-containing protein [Chitinivibrio alkaliphilus]|uniref:Cadherin domain-containing protein n=1 Tax=Chitinivibrio alkaliphilus ACht1 TaxID=1313304 RepID=U7D5A3_9BACT|nr:Ig-like domain-containing protein [Chitinivibrio alkaliphilus]ERP30746.1 hypothetical protein CALK_2411 [Chitinivibrio alkaliphilus ACht1]
MFGGNQKILNVCFVLCTFLLGNVWADRLDIGDDFDNPVLDPFLIQHSMYAQESFKVGDAGSSPRAGIVGTAGIFDGGDFTINTEDGAFLQEITGWSSSINENAFLYYKTGGADFSPSERKQQVDADNVYEEFEPYRRPLLPNTDNVIFEGGDDISNGSIEPGHYGTLGGRNNTLLAGTYFFESINLWDNSVTTITPNNGSYRTVIYVKEDITSRTTPYIVPEGFEDDDGDISIPEEALGEILIIGLSAINLGDDATIVGTLLAPNGEIEFRWGSRLLGQILALKFKSNGIDGGDGIDFIPIIRDEISIGESVFNEHQNQDKTPDRIDLHDGTTQSYDTTITVQINAVPENKSVKIFYTLAGDGFDHGTYFHHGTEDDRRESSGRLVFEEGDTAKTIDVHIIDDLVHDGDRDFFVIVDSTVTNDPNDNYDVLVPEEPFVITITEDDPENTPPDDIILDTQSVKENQPGGTVVSSVVVEDDNDNVKTVAVTNGAPFSVTGNPAAGWELVTDEEFNYDEPEEPRSFDVKITATDELGESLEKTFTIGITPVNDNAPEGSDAEFSTYINTPLDASIPEGRDDDLPEDNTTLTYHVVGKPGSGVVEITNAEEGRFTYTPDPGFVGVDSFTYRIRDEVDYSNWYDASDPDVDSVLYSEEYTITITVKNNILPDIDLSSDGGLVFADDSVDIVLDFSDGDLFPDVPDFTLSYTVTYAGDVVTDTLSRDEISSEGTVYTERIYVDSFVTRENTAATGFDLSLSLTADGDWNPEKKMFPIKYVSSTPLQR